MTPWYLASVTREVSSSPNGFVLVPDGCSGRVHRVIYDWCAQEGMGMILLTSNAETIKP